MNIEVRKWLEKDGANFLREIGIKKGQIVLDFGCGKGYYAIPASRVVQNAGKIYALDKDRNELENFKKVIHKDKIKNIELLNPFRKPGQSIESYSCSWQARGHSFKGINKNSRIPLKDDSVDVVLCYDVIHFGNRKERKAIYDEVYRVLKKQGLFSVYPKHHKEDCPLMELADINLESVLEEIEKAGFILECKFLKTLLHDEDYNEGYILNFKKY